jgi:carbon monoxide dehydrogenase subunit G
VELTNRFRVSVPIEEAWKVLTDLELIAPCMPGAQLQEVEGDEYRGIVKVKVGPITAQYKGSARFLKRDDGAHEAVLKAEGRDTRGQGNANATITATLRGDGDGTAVTVVTDLTITGKVAQFGRGVLVDVSGKLLNQFVDCLEHDLLGGGAEQQAGAEPAPAAAAALAPVPAAASAPAPVPAAAAASSADAPAQRSASNGHTRTEEPKPARPAKKAAAAVTPAGAPPKSEPKKGPAKAPAKKAASAPAAATVPKTSATLPDETKETPAIRKIDHAAAEPVDLLDAAGVPVAKRAIPIVAGVLVILWFMRRRRRRRRRP